MPTGSKRAGLHQPANKVSSGLRAAPANKGLAAGRCAQAGGRRPHPRTRGRKAGRGATGVVTGQRATRPLARARLVPFRAGAERAAIVQVM